MKLITSLLAAAPAVTSLFLLLPFLAHAHPALEERQTCAPLVPTNPTTYWYESITHNGMSPFISSGASWSVHRNVRSSPYGAAGDGTTDDTAALQAAINAGNSAAGRNSNSFGTTGQPAVVYLPKGVYLLKSPIQLFVGTVLMGDPTDPPTIKAADDFDGTFMIYGKDPNQGPTTNFYIGMKNLKLDSTAVDKDQTFTLLDWSVSQNTQLTNVEFFMPYESAGHTGVAMPEGGSGTEINDCYFRGGAVGLDLNNQQYHLKGLTFFGCTIGIKVSFVFEAVGQGLRFEACGIGIDTSSGNSGFFALIDSSAANVGALVNTMATEDGQDSIVLEGVSVSDVTSTVTASGTIVLTGSVPPNQAWVWGNAYVPSGPTTGAHQKGTLYTTASRPASLVDSSGAYHRFTPPTYAGYSTDQFVNVKSDPTYPVAGDGVTDDTASLQAIINAYAGCKILFFPHGTYIVTGTLTFPPGSRVVGEVWSEISATGSKFYDPSNPVPMVRVGERGDVGVAQFSDMLFTVADVLQGCTLLEVNMAGSQPGDVAFWNTHFRVGGGAGSKVRTNCGGSAWECKAAFMLAHLTSTSSAYVDNMWGWTADHDLEGTLDQLISVGRGMLVEATQGTWLLGLAFEHNTLYQVNIDSAANVFIGFQQSEAPYWQGSGQAALAPEPWYPVVWESDPDFSYCSGGDSQCRMALYQRINNSKNLRLYGGGFWTFFNNGRPCEGDCQSTGIRIDDTTGLYYFGISTHLIDTIVVQDGEGLATHYYNPGGWGGVVAAYLTASG